MKSYYDLIPISAKVNRKKSQMTRMCIILAVFLVTVIFGMADMEIRSQKLQTIYSEGEWHANLMKITDDQAATITKGKNIALTTWYGIYNYNLDKDCKINDIESVICGVDNDFYSMFPASALIEGDYPSMENDIILTESAKNRLGLKLSDQVNISFTENENMEFTVCGFVDDAAMLTKGDAIGALLNTKGFRMLPEVANLDYYNSVFYVQFKPYHNIQKAIDKISLQFELTEEQIGENTKLLAMMMQSEDAYMIQLYLTAVILAILVTVAGILMITSSMSNNISQRTEFFGMLRCLGATPKQIRNYVRREALSWCKKAIPIGVLLGIAVVWFLCILLKVLNPDYFKQFPLFSISWISIIMGILIGVLTVLFAARTPAKKAAKVSPLIAITGNALTIYPVKEVADTNKFTVEIALGIHHAKGNKRNFILMVMSFAFSIILYLAFSTAVDFMNHAITPLQPFTPDISIIGEGMEDTLPIELKEKISKMDGVNKVYATSVVYGLSVNIDGEEKEINLISYDDIQFQWAADLLLDGEIKHVQDNLAVLKQYASNNPLKVESSFTIHVNDEIKKIPIVGVVSATSFSKSNEIENIICSEQLFQQLTGMKDYNIIYMKLKRDVTEEQINAIREVIGENIIFSDQRLSNNETKGMYYSFALFIYGFLVAVVMISVFNIVNSLAMSVSSRMKQYGVMRAIGMSNKQLKKMVSAEAILYGVIGCIFGCIIGIPINKVLFEKLVTFQWGDEWYFPIFQICLILVVMAGSVGLAVKIPFKKIDQMSIVETINAE